MLQSLVMRIRRAEPVQLSSLRSAAALATVGLGAVCLLGVLLRPLLPVDETRYLDVAWEMWLSGDVLLPTKNFELYTHKPPLLFWAINLVWSVTGVSEVAARLVGPALALLSVGLTALLARRLWPARAGIGARAALALCANLVFVLYGGLTMFDTALTVSVLAGMLALEAAVRTGARRAWLGVGLALALGVLAKGPVIGLHLGPALLLYPLWRGEGRARGARGPLLAFALALGVLALWVVPAAILGGEDYRTAILWTQTAGRVVSSFDHARPWWMFLALLPVLLFPWIWSPRAWAMAWRAPWGEPALRLCLIWIAAAFVLFSAVSGKQVHYLLPEFPAVALIVARLTGEGPAPSLRGAAALVAAGALALAGAALGLVPVGDAAEIAEPAAHALGTALLLAGVALAGLWVSGLPGAALISLGTVVALNLLVGTTALGPKFDTRPMAGELARFDETGLAHYGDAYSAEFNFSARLRHRVAEIADPDALAEWCARHPAGAIVGRSDIGGPDWRPLREAEFRGYPYGVWSVAEAPGDACGRR